MKKQIVIPPQEKINKQTVGKLLCTIDKGLCNGIGTAQPGEMCVMAAINYVLNGDGRNDRVNCVLRELNSFDIHLNDQEWSGDQARAEGMREEAVAKLGSTGINPNTLLKLIIKNIDKAFRAEAMLMVKPEYMPTHREIIYRLALKNIKSNKSTLRDAGYFMLDSLQPFDGDGDFYEHRFPTRLLRALEDLTRKAKPKWGDLHDFVDAIGDPCEDGVYGVEDDYERDGALTRIANATRDALKKLKSEGSKYLYLCKLGEDELLKLGGEKKAPPKNPKILKKRNGADQHW